MKDRTLEEIIELVKGQAIARAIEIGVFLTKATVIDMEVAPLSYLLGNVLRVKAKAAGNLQL